ncbi:MAG: GNAT family N-acetyltransferase [Acidimicrobiia bacterium]|nr:GNAT family N-acetyltransferase [Acidimicrobiia bacterium]
MTRWTVRHVRADEYEQWSRLFTGYADFYEWPTSASHQRQIWGWIHDEGSIEALVAVECDDEGAEIGEAQGLAHLREWVRPLRGVRCGYLDDLFVEPSVRGSGAVDALFRRIDEIARERAWDVVRWTTAEDNTRAQTAYDRVATRTTWVTYDMAPRPSTG